MGIRFTKVGSCKDFPEDKTEVFRLEANVDTFQSIFDSGTSAFAPASTLFEEACSDNTDLCTLMTTETVTENGLQSALIAPEEASGFRNRVRNLFGKMSSDHIIDAKEEVHQLQQFEFDFLLKKIEPFIRESGKSETWMGADSSRLRILMRLVMSDFRFAGVSKKQQAKLNNLKERLSLSPWENPEVLNHLAHTVISFGGRETDFLGFFFGNVERFFKSSQKVEDEIGKAIIARIRFFPEEIESFHLNNFLNLAMGESESGILRKFLLGNETTPPSDILKRVLEKKDQVPSWELLNLTVNMGHPDMLQWIDKAMGKGGFPPMETTSEEQFMLYEIFTMTVLNISLAQHLNFTLNHFKPLVEHFGNKWTTKIPEVYRGSSPLAFFFLKHLLEGNDSGKKNFDTLERHYQADLKNKKQSYSSPNFLVLSRMLTDPHFFPASPASIEDLENMSLKALLRLAEEWGNPIGVEGLIEGFKNGKSLRWRTRSLHSLSRLATKEEIPEEIKEKVLDFFDTGITLDLSKELSYEEISSIQSVMRSTNRELRHSYDIFKNIATSETAINGSGSVIETLGQLALADRYHGDPLETLSSVTLEDRNQTVSELAFQEISRGFDEMNSLAEGNQNNVARYQDALLRLAQSPHSKTVESAEVLLRKAKAIPELGLQETLTQISLEGLVEVFPSDPRKTRWVLQDLGILGHPEAVDFFLKNLEQSESGLGDSIALKQILTETLKSNIQSHIVESALEMTLNMDKINAYFLLEDAATIPLESGFEALLQVALDRRVFRGGAIEKLLQPEATTLPENYWDIISQLDEGLSFDIGSPVSIHDEIPSYLLKYSDELYDLLGETKLGSAIRKFYDAKARLDQRAEKISATGDAEIVDSAEVVETGSDSADGDETDSVGFKENDIHREDSRDFKKRVLTPYDSPLTVEVVDLDRKFKHRLSQNPFEVADSILVSEMPLATIEKKLRALILNAELGDTRTQIALMELIDNAAALAQIGEKEGLFILEMIASEGGPFMSGQAAAALEDISK